MSDSPSMQALLQTIEKACPAARENFLSELRCYQNNDLYPITDLEGNPIHEGNPVYDDTAALLQAVVDLAHYAVEAVTEHENTPPNDPREMDQVHEPIYPASTDCPYCEAPWSGPHAPFCKGVYE